MLVEYLKRGVAAGVVAGVLYGLFLAVVANPLIEYMEHLEHDHGHGHGDHAHVVSETTTAIVSVGSGVLWAILLGGVFGLAYYVFEPALPGTQSIKTTVLAGAAFLTVSVIPWLVIPPAAPGAEQAFTNDLRLLIYAGLMVVGALVATLAILSYRRTASEYGVTAGALVGIGVVVIAGVVISISTPTIVTGGEMPADLVVAFQGLVVLSQAAIWLVIAVGFEWFGNFTETTTTLEKDLTASTEP